jgi:hypothetical protein
MDKRKVIAAYRRGFITIHECAQILGMDFALVQGLINDPGFAAERRSMFKKQPMGG